MKHALFGMLGGEHPQAIFDFSNLCPADTGLREVVWVASNASGQSHRPRGKIRAAVDNLFYPFTLDDPMERGAGLPPGFSVGDVKQLGEFVRLNRVTLLAYWNEEISTRQMVDVIKPLAG